MGSKRRSNMSKGTTTELMPCIMGAIDALWDNGSNSIEDNERLKSSAHRKQFQGNSFANLSPNVQKILANVPDEDLSKNFSSDEYLAHKKQNLINRSCSNIREPRSSPEKSVHRSNESLDIISPSVQKMLSNLPDAELVINSCSIVHNSDKNSCNKNSSFLYNKSPRTERNPPLKSSKSFTTAGSGCTRSFLYKRSPDTKDAVFKSVSDSLSAIDLSESGVNRSSTSEAISELEAFSPKPLGSYLHTSPSGIASRTPVGRKNMGKYLQVPSESSVGTNSTASSEVSRPVSLTSLGSCSSSSSGGAHQPGSAYLASAESLDSDPEPTGSQGSADSGIATTMSPEQCVLQEVMDTETVYVADLQEVITGYLEQWRRDPECPLSEHLQDLFSNLEEIYTFNRRFLEALQQANYDPTLIANAFLVNDAGFSVYTEYCTNYPRTMAVLGELTRDEHIASLFREKQVALGHALPLGSYLLKPVQRILKYHLLLQRLSKQCDSTHKPAVDLALTTMTSVASHINTMKRKHEHAVRVQEIQAQLYGWSGPDLTALGELIAEGTFRVGGARGRRHVFLFDKVLLLAKSKPDGGLAYKSHIMCSNLMLVEQVRGELLSFHILPFDNPRQQCTLRARSPQHKREWTLQLKRVILENYNAIIPNHARQLVMQLGQELHDVEDTTDKWSPLKQHSTPQYLERRSRVRKSRDFINRRAASHDRSFPSLTNWRRKSEPGIIQYTTKAIPKRITKIKKEKDANSVFYTDLSDSENCEPGIGTSTDSLAMYNENQIEFKKDKCEDIEESSLEVENDSHMATNTLEKVVSDLLMQNEEFQKILNRQRKSVRDCEPVTGIWQKQDDLPSKADSLPRDFQLNDQLDNEKKENINSARCNLLFSKKQPDVELEDLQENDMSSHLDDNEHPEHRIYRKSAIRFSLVQRFRAIISEEQQRRTKKLPTYKQGSKSMGAKIAEPDYVDPQKLFGSKTFSRSDISINCCDNERNNEDLMGERENLDMTINEKEVLSHGDKVRREFEKRLWCSAESNDISVDDTVKSNNSSTSSSSNTLKSSQTSISNSVKEVRNCTPDIFNSSQSSDGYYESLMEKNLNEEAGTLNVNGRPKSQPNEQKYVENTSVTCSDSGFVRTNPNRLSLRNTSLRDSKRLIKRPTNAPPPIPTKPLRLLSCNNNENYNKSDPPSENNLDSVINNSVTAIKNNNQKLGSVPDSSANIKNANTISSDRFVSCKINNGSDNTKIFELPSPISSKGWVKTIVGRFE